MITDKGRSIDGAVVVEPARIAGVPCEGVVSHEVTGLGDPEIPYFQLQAVARLPAMAVTDTATDKVVARRSGCGP